MTWLSPSLSQILDSLEKFYGPQKLVGPNDPYEMILYVTCGYPATDISCSKGFEALKREVGVSPAEILAAPEAKLAKLMRLGGIVPEQRAERLKEIARLVKREFGGDLKAVLKKSMLDEKQQTGQGVRAAKKVLKKFPVIGEPGAEKILLFSKLAPLAAVPSAFVEVAVRLKFGDVPKDYASSYRQAREVISAEVSESFEARQRAYLLLKKHAQEICKRLKPKCEVCPLTAQCAYFQALAADCNAI